LTHGYRFVLPADVLAGLDPGGYYVLLTFDDGYANNQRALPILRALSVPATFFISARHVSEGCAFWWDVVYRERRHGGAGIADIGREISALKSRTPEDIEFYVRRSFGAGALQPVSDTDRPFTTAELRAFAADPLVTLGNHTNAHADLTRLDGGRVAAEIRECQAYLTSVSGRAPDILAYPDGRYDQRSIAAATDAGLRLAVTVGPGKTSLPLSANAAMTIARAWVPCGNGLAPACVRSRSDTQLRRWLISRRH
jgi:peptidoglycan/xylan/chitin deacetylase (PgdA/CDA1 family)